MSKEVVLGSKINYVSIGGRLFDGDKFQKHIDDMCVKWIGFDRWSTSRRIPRKLKKKLQKTTVGLSFKRPTNNC